MELIVVSVRDRAMDSFGRPVFVTSLGVALRSFADEMNRPGEDNSMYKHPEDYDLYHLGSFDEESGKFSNLDIPTLLSRGDQVAIRKE